MSQSHLATAKPLNVEEPPRASRGIRRRTEILNAAEDVFLKKGYGNTTMDDIAASAGASKATMYKHFGSKEMLFAEHVRRSVPDIARGSTQALRAKGSLHTILENWSLQLLKKVTTPRAVAMFKLIISESSRSPELAKIYYEKGPAAAHAQLAEFFREAVADGRMCCHDPEMASRLFVSAAFGDGFERALFGIHSESDAKITAYVREAVAMFIARYGSRA